MVGGVETSLKIASWWHPASEPGVIQCDLCPHRCRLLEGGVSCCGVRSVVQGQLVTLVYGNPAAIHVDPIEKKPLCHFLPGTTTFSIGTAGCNLSCRFCQNWELSTTRLTPATAKPPQAEYAPERLALLARNAGCASVALTYNEPTVWAEYGLDIALAAHQAGLKVVSVTNGYIEPAAAEALYRHVDAANVDLKSFDDAFYRCLCGGRLAPVLATLKLLRRLGVHLEITNLLIPKENDDVSTLRHLCAWVATELGAETPIHFSAFHPAHQMLTHDFTPRRLLEEAARAATGAGLRHVHLGNLRIAVS